MSQDVESVYEQYISNLRQVLPNVDPNFAHRVMYMERKLAEEGSPEPHVSMIIEYKSGVDTDRKVNDLRQKFSLEVEHGEKSSILHAMTRMKMEKVKNIASDRDIVKITGKVDPTMGE